MAEPKTIDPTPAAAPNVDTPLIGRFITLEKLNFEGSHISQLWNDFGTDEETWRWLPDGLPKNEKEFRDGFRELVDAKVVVFVVMGDPEHLNPPGTAKAADQKSEPEALGMMMYGDINTTYRILEAGAIFGPRMRRSYASTEAHYLLLSNVLSPKEGLPYRRVSWKTNTLNLISQRTAARLGFVHEGVFRNHMIDRGMSRDSWWASLIEEDWEGGAKRALEAWLDLGNFDESGRQKRRLEDIRKGLE